MNAPRYSVSRKGFKKTPRPVPVPPVSIEQDAIAAIRADLAGAPEDCLRFFEVLFRNGRDCHTTGAIAWHLAINPRTLLGRFHRLGLPSVRLYLRYAAYVRLARMLEDPGVSFVAACRVLDTAAAQSLDRPIQHMLGMTGDQFRRAYDGAAMLQVFRERLILPYRETLLAFRPLIVELRRSSRARGAVAA